MPEPILLGYASVQSDPVDHNLVVRLKPDVLDDAEYLLAIAPRDVPAFIRAVTSEGLAVLSDVAASDAAGDCATCLNRRLIEVPAAGGRTMSDHCPDCTVAPPFAVYPRLGGGTTAGGVQAARERVEQREARDA